MLIVVKSKNTICTMCFLNAKVIGSTMDTEKKITSIGSKA